MNRKITQDELRKFLSYDPITGLFTTVYSIHSSRIGKVAGHVNKRGYVTLSVLGNTCRAHQLAWLDTYGKYPDMSIDHIDGNRSNNAISNLRELDTASNNQNIQKEYSTNKTGLLGAYFCKSKNRYKPAILANGERHLLGSYKTAEEAHHAYMMAKARLHPTCGMAQRYVASISTTKD